MLLLVNALKKAKGEGMSIIKQTMEIKLNILNSKTNAEALIPLEVDINEFWVYYLQMLALKGLSLTQRELELCAAFISSDHNNIIDCKKEMAVRINVSTTNIMPLITKLIEKGLINQNGTLNDKIKRFKDFILTNTDSIAISNIIFAVPLKIKRK